MSMPQLSTAEKITIDEYLRLEREAEHRSEFLDGEIIAMAGESSAHGEITVNLVGVLHAQLKGKRCRARTKDTKVRSGPNRPHGSGTKGLFSYPDALVICDDIIFHDEHRDVVLNPTAVIEVLSPSTEAFDRGQKFIRLRDWNPTLMDYVLISQAEPRIEVFHREDDSTWSLKSFAGLDASALLTAVDCVLPLAEIYDRVEFPPADDGTDSGTTEDV